MKLVVVPLIPLNCHLIDCSSIMVFSGADYANPMRFTTYREQIWTFLENKVDSDKLKTVPQVWGELEFNDPAAWERLRPRRNQFLLPSEHDTDLRIINILSKYPKLVDKNQHYTRDPADPYLIAYAQKWGLPIICDEKPLEQRIGARKSKRLMIPDVCKLEKNMICINLEKYLKDEGVIPQSYDPTE